MTLTRAAALSVMAHAALFALLPAPGSGRAQPAPPELVVWCTLQEEPEAVTPGTRRVPAAPAAPRQLTPVPEKEPPVAPPAPEQLQLPVPPEPQAPLLTAATPVVQPAFTTPSMALPPEAPAPAAAAPRAAEPATVPAAATGGGVVTVSALRYRSAPPPEYPALARRRGYEGTVRLQVEVDMQGRVASVTLAQSSGYEVLDVAAARAVRAWTFVPVLVDGVPHRARGMVPVRFALR